MSREFYGDARVLAVQLADIGLGDWASRIEDVIKSSWACTGTCDS